MTDPDYQLLIDGPTWDFIRRSESFAVDDPGIAAQRAAYDRMCAAFEVPYPPGVTARDETIGGLRMRHYRTARAGAAALYLHGGSFMLGGLHSHDSVCAELAATGLALTALDYRLAPEHRHPAAIEDTLSAARMLAARGGPLLLIGDSAGGALAAMAAHALRGTGLIRGVVLIYPGLGGDPDHGSYLIHAQAPMLSRADILAAKAILQADASGPAFPLAQRDYAGLPPILAFAAQCDPLADDVSTYCARVRAAGGQAQGFEDAGMVHGWLRARHSVPRAARAFARICRAVADAADPLTQGFPGVDRAAPDPA